MFLKFKYFFPLACACFLLSINYYILKSLKDALLITAKISGAETIPFIKVWVILPVSILMAFAFTWLTNHFKLKSVFYCVITFFLSFFFIFTFVLYPLSDYLHPHAFADRLQTMLPSGWKGLVAVIRYWSFTAFYVMAECWGSIVYSVLFWGLANQATKLTDAQKFYPLLILAGNLSAIAAGNISLLLSPTDFNPSFKFGNNAWDQSLILLTLAVMVCGGGVLLFFHWISVPEIEHHTSSQKESVMTFRQSISSLFHTPYLVAIALLVFSFNMVMNLSEVQWKNQILQVYSNPNDYHIYLSYVSVWIGVVSTCLTLVWFCVSQKKGNWRSAALFTPLITLITAVIFFGCLFAYNYGQLDFIFFTAESSLPFLALIGSFHICLSRSGKHTLFEATKEIAFIPLEPDLKLKGKTLVDGIGLQMGKASSSMIYQGLLVFLPSIGACAPVVACILMVALLICLLCVKFLGREWEARYAGMKVETS